MDISSSEDEFVEYVVRESNNGRSSGERRRARAASCRAECSASPVARTQNAVDISRQVERCSGTRGFNRSTIFRDRHRAESH